MSYKVQNSAAAQALGLRWSFLILSTITPCSDHRSTNWHILLKLKLIRSSQFLHNLSPWMGLIIVTLQPEPHNPRSAPKFCHYLPFPLSETTWSSLCSAPFLSSSPTWIMHLFLFSRAKWLPIFWNLFKTDSMFLYRVHSSRFLCLAVEGFHRKWFHHSVIVRPSSKQGVWTAKCLQ